MHCSCCKLNQILCISGSCFVYGSAVVVYQVVPTIPGQGPEGYLVLKLENEVGPPLQIQKTMLILQKSAFLTKRSSYSSMSRVIHPIRV